MLVVGLVEPAEAEVVVLTGQNGNGFNYVGSTLFPTTAGEPASATAFGGEGDPAHAQATGGTGGNGGAVFFYLNGIQVGSYSFDGAEGGEADALAQSWGDTQQAIESIASAGGGHGGSYGPRAGNGGGANSDAIAINVSPIGSAEANSSAQGGSGGSNGIVYFDHGPAVWLGGAPSSATSNSYASGGYNSESTAYAMGGNGGNIQSGDGPILDLLGFVSTSPILNDGGNATAHATGAYTGTNGRVSATAEGGTGGFFFGRGGNGGMPSATAHGETTQGDVYVSANQLGGRGGNAYNGGGDGADSRMIDAVTGSAPGRLYLTQFSKGGDSGSAIISEERPGRQGGRAGDASSVLIQSNPGGGDVSISSSAQGGQDSGSPELYLTSSDGGNADSIARGVSDSGSSYVYSQANGGYSPFAHYGDGMATAEAIGFHDATAYSFARGRNTVSISKSESIGSSIATSDANSDLGGFPNDSISSTAISSAIGDHGYAEASASVNGTGIAIYTHSSIGSTASVASEIRIGDASSNLTGQEKFTVQAMFSAASLVLKEIDVSLQFPVDGEPTTHLFTAGLTLPSNTSFTLGHLSGSFEYADIRIDMSTGSEQFFGGIDYLTRQFSNRSFSNVSGFNLTIMMNAPGQTLSMAVVVPEPSAWVLTTVGVMALSLLLFVRRTPFVRRI
jgi:hypothetical protein